MAKNVPGKHYRNGITLVELFQLFPDDATAEKWFVECGWADGIRCAYLARISTTKLNTPLCHIVAGIAENGSRSRQTQSCRLLM